MPKVRKKTADIFMVLGGCLWLIGISGLIYIFPTPLSSQADMAVTREPTVIEETGFKDFGLKINKLKLNVPVVAEVDGYNQALYLEALKFGVAHFKGTSLPSETGNTVIFGHSSNLPWIPGEYKEVFASLNSLEKGDKITLYYKNEILNYEVTKRQTIKPDDFSVLEKTSEPTLTLMTCYPFGLDTQRLIVKAVRSRVL